MHLPDDCESQTVIAQGYKHVDTRTRDTVELAITQVRQSEDWAAY